MVWQMELILSHCLSIVWLRSSEAVGPRSLHLSPHHPAWTKIFWTQRPVLSTRRSHFRDNEDFWDNALLYRGKKVTYVSLGKALQVFWKQPGHVHISGLLWHERSRGQWDRGRGGRRARGQGFGIFAAFWSNCLVYSFILWIREV